jgi:hypothetical protein
VTNGDASNAGFVTLKDSGFLTLHGSSVYRQRSGVTNLVNGGQLTAETLTFDSGALQGSGTVSGFTTIFNGASIVPGADSNSGGTLTFTDGPLAVFGTFVEFLHPSGFGSAAVHGSVTLDAKSSVLTIQQEASYAPTIGTVLEILTSSTPIDTRFHRVDGASFDGKTKYWATRYNRNGNNIVLEAVLGCGDERTDIIAEYVNLEVKDTWKNGLHSSGVAFVPKCNQFTTSAHPPTPDITFADLIKSDDYSAALIKRPLTIDSQKYGLMLLRQALDDRFHRKPIINSAYRNPAHNADLPGPVADKTSRHMFGDAVDFANQSQGLAECGEMRHVAALAATDSPDHIEKCKTTKKQGYHLHVDWSNRDPGQYVQ